MPYSTKIKQIAEQKRFDILNKNLEDSKKFYKGKRNLFSDLEKLNDPEQAEKTTQTLLNCVNKNFNNIDKLMYGLQSDVESVREHSIKIEELKQTFQETDKSDIVKVLTVAIDSNNLTTDTFEKFLSVEPGLLTTEAVTEYAGLSTEGKTNWAQRTEQQQLKQQIQLH